MDKLKNQVITGKSIRLLQQNQYTFQVDLKLTKTGMKDWIERFFDVKVEGINSSRMTSKNGKKKNKLNITYVSYKKMIVRLKKNYFIPLFMSQT
uniref:Large ribosomal subunit protein uL23c n=1 Tax=Adiantum capillus-veneris TaxID=13818 RepID=RK23_ADICA|nr:ribosomal protein L23 [Adiantum capillus-veneris]Q85FI0.2 RecName: Full=Large ribosomal subunit protein uL23c; AltName: Full=50S ribosomal protein L23, chloroplastic [Adiantum capillus-veneris]AAP29433.2 ribosomal protein L23 [Adiantum capillus-veneris]